MQHSPVLALCLTAALGLCSCSEEDPGPTQTGALVLTSDFDTGSISSVDLVTRQVSVDIEPAHSDAVCRVQDGAVFVINRFLQDNVQILDPANGYTTVRQFSTGNGSNPQDICLSDSSTAFVPVYGTARLLVKNPRTGLDLGTIDLASAAAVDGIPEMSACVAVGDRVYVTLQNLNNFAVTGQSRMAIIDARTRTLVRTVALTGQNPFTRIFHDEARDRLLFGSVGTFDALDGGVEAFDLRTETSAGFVVTEQTLGGNLAGFAPFRSDKAFAVVTDPGFATKLLSFNPQTGQRLATLADATDADPSDSDYDYWAVAVNDREEVYVADVGLPAPGLRVFSAVTDQSLTSTPLDVGLPPRDICFTEE